MADYTGSFSGSFQGTISGSLLGSGIVSGSTQIDFNSIVNKPTTIQPFQANSIVSNNRFREVTYPAISASTSTRFTTIETNASTLSTQTTTVSASVSTRITALTSDVTTLQGQTTTVSASTSTRFTTIESSVSTLSGQVQAAVSGTVPPGTISSSTQIAALGYLTSASAAAVGFGSGGGSLTFITESGNLSLSEIEVADFDNNVAITFVDGRLKFIFGTPTEPTSLAATLSVFETDRFNNITDAYSVNGTWNNQGYTLVSASLYEGATLLTQTGSGTSLTFSTTTSGSHTYKLEYTASSPLDGSLFKTSTTTTGTVSKTNPAAPTLSATPSVQLGFSSNQIEQGATGSITFTSSSAHPSNSWNLTSVTTNVTSPYLVTGSATGSTSISIIATANYASPLGDNIPDLTTTSTTTTTYTKIRSLRYGASTATSFTAAELANLATWDTTLGGSIGTIDKGNVIPSGDSLTITWSGDKYIYIVYDSAQNNLTNITTAGFSVFSSFTLTTVGSYKIYRSNTLQAGGAGNSITYILT